MGECSYSPVNSTCTSRSTARQIEYSRHANTTSKNRRPESFAVVAATNRLIDLSPGSISQLYLYSVRRPLPRFVVDTEYVQVIVVFFAVVYAESNRR